MKLLWLLFSFNGRLDAAAFTPWWALYAVPVFFAGFATGTTSGYVMRGVLALGYFLLTLIPLAAIATKRLRDAGRPLWLALPACLTMPIAAAVLLAVQHADVRPPISYVAFALALAMIAGWVFLMESLRRAPSARKRRQRGRTNGARRSLGG
ncbi:MAG: DUF805 domain-containing protein [Bradyrhizobiaceae bacterium]|nr:DUF805 domain-containing protein [Bradyrhizobiaceae bacterium]